MTVYCNMDNRACGGGVWTGVARYDFSDSSTTCPGNWYQITSPIRACGRTSGIGCVSALFFTNSIQFNRVCGRVIAVQYGCPRAFYTSHNYHNLRNIEQYYVDGVSITHGNPRQHIWTFAAYPEDRSGTRSRYCPCGPYYLNRPSPPPLDFLDNNYFCETGTTSYSLDTYFTGDSLWDG